DLMVGGEDVLAPPRQLVVPGVVLAVAVACGGVTISVLGIAHRVLLNSQTVPPLVLGRFGDFLFGSDRGLRRRRRLRRGRLRGALVEELLEFLRGIDRYLGAHLVMGQAAELRAGRVKLAGL